MPPQKGSKYRERYTEEEIEDLCSDLVDWAKTTTSIHLASYTYERFRSGRSYLYDLSATWPQVKKALGHAKEMIAERMSNACYRSTESGVNAVFGEKYLPIYDSEYKELLEWKAKIAHEQQRTDTNKGIVEQLAKDIRNEKT
jgi:hypothetical protein